VLSFVLLRYVGIYSFGLGMPCCSGLLVSCPVRIVLSVFGVFLALRDLKRVFHMFRIRVLAYEFLLCVLVWLCPLYIVASYFPMRRSLAFLFHAFVGLAGICPGISSSFLSC